MTHSLISLTWLGEKHEETGLTYFLRVYGLFIFDVIVQLFLWGAWKSSRLYSVLRLYVIIRDNWSMYFEMFI
jgi:hypothetical protein